AVRPRDQGGSVRATAMSKPRSSRRRTAFICADPAKSIRSVGLRDWMRWTISGSALAMSRAVASSARAHVARNASSPSSGTEEPPCAQRSGTSGECHRGPAVLEEIEHVGATQARCRGEARYAVLRRERWIGAVIEQALEVVQRCAVREGIVKWTRAPVTCVVGVGTVIEQPRHAVVVVPIHLAAEHQA